jgi:hypothetical protein
MDGAALLARRQGDSVLCIHALDPMTIQRAAEAVLFLSIFRNELRRASPNTNVTGLASLRLDDRFVDSPFNHGLVSPILFQSAAL